MSCEFHWLFDSPEIETHSFGVQGHWAFAAVLKNKIDMSIALKNLGNFIIIKFVHHPSNDGNALHISSTIVC